MRAPPRSPVPHGSIPGVLFLAVVFLALRLGSFECFSFFLHGFINLFSRQKQGASTMLVFCDAFVVCVLFAYFCLFVFSCRFYLFSRQKKYTITMLVFVILCCFACFPFFFHVGSNFFWGQRKYASMILVFLVLVLMLLALVLLAAVAK